MYLPFPVARETIFLMPGVFRLAACVDLLPVREGQRVLVVGFGKQHLVTCFVAIGVRHAVVVKDLNALLYPLMSRAIVFLLLVVRICLVYTKSAKRLHAYCVRKRSDNVTSLWMTPEYFERLMPLFVTRTF